MRGFETTHEVSDLGRVRSSVARPGVRRGHVLSQHVRTGRGGARALVCLVVGSDGRRRELQVGRAVLMSHKPLPEMRRRRTIHKDGDPENNALRNLQWSKVGSRELDLLADLAAPGRRGVDLGARACSECFKPFKHWGTTFQVCPPCREAATVRAKAPRLRHHDGATGSYASQKTRRGNVEPKKYVPLSAADEVPTR